MAVTAIVPLKALPAAKGRLAGALAPDDRRALVAWMAQRVLTACSAAHLVGDVLLVAGDADGAAIGRDAGVSVLQVDQPGLQLALDTADHHLRDADVTVVIAADLPAATADEIDTVVAAVLSGTRPAVVITPTADGGTGALARRPAGLISTAYGPASARRHAELATAAGAHWQFVHLAGLAADVDTPLQLSAALARSARDHVGFRPH